MDSIPRPAGALFNGNYRLFGALANGWQFQTMDGRTWQKTGDLTAVCDGVEYPFGLYVPVEYHEEVSCAADSP